MQKLTDEYKSNSGYMARSGCAESNGGNISLRLNPESCEYFSGFQPKSDWVKVPMAKMNLRNVIISFFLIFLFVVSTEAQDVKWTAQWIMHPTVEPQAYSVVLFRKNFELPTKPEKLTLGSATAVQSVNSLPRSADPLAGT